MSSWVIHQLFRALNAIVHKFEVHPAYLIACFVAKTVYGLGTYLSNDIPGLRDQNNKEQVFSQKT